MRVRQLDLKRIGPGGKRKGAGRKRAEGSRDWHHGIRRRVRDTDGVHVVLRTLPDVPRLRCPAGLDAIRFAIEAKGEQEGFRVVHFSIQHNHLHFLVEAADGTRLWKGMQAFGISLARAINRAFLRSGKVFAYRFHSTVFSSPTHARRAIAYVLGNWRHHNEDERGRAEQEALVDPYSSAPTFTGWKQAVSVSYQTIVLAEPKTWLLRAGWRDRGGGPLDCFRAPGRL